MGQHLKSSEEDFDLHMRRLRWCCRRGMLELDLIFEAFLQNNYLNSDKDTQKTFENLLSCQDQELYEWLVARKSMPTDLKLKKLVEQIRQRD